MWDYGGSSRGQHYTDYCPALAFANGSGRILDKYARGIDLGSGKRTAQTSDGFPMRVYADDLIGRHPLMSGMFDAAAPDGALGSILARAGYRVRELDKRLLKTALVPINLAADC